MRASFVLSEVATGLRRNITMTVAMILTTAISLSIFGGGLLIVRAVDQMQSNLYSETQVSVYLTDDSSATDTNCSKAPCADLKSSLENSAGIDSVTYENRQQVFDRFKKIFAAQPELVRLTRSQALPATLHVKLADPSKSAAVVQEFQGKPGVKSVDDQQQFLKKLFDGVGAARTVVFAIALVAAVAALLLISNTIQLSAFNRRTEVSIMRLVGATRWYTQLPFLLEAVVSGVIGALVGIAFLCGFVALIQPLLGVVGSGIVPAVGYADVALVAPILVLVAIAISAVTGYITLRLYVRR